MEKNQNNSNLNLEEDNLFDEFRHKELVFKLRIK